MYAGHYPNPSKRLPGPVVQRFLSVKFFFDVIFVGQRLELGAPQMLGKCSFYH